MEINYETKDIREVVQFPAKAIALYGPAAARVLAVRFADLRALPNAAELAFFLPRQIAAQGIPALEVELADSYSVILVPNHPRWQPEPIVNWANVKRVKVLNIVRSHEDV